MNGRVGSVRDYLTRDPDFALEIPHCPYLRDGPNIALWASFTASGGTTSAFCRDTLGGGQQQAGVCGTWTRCEECELPESRLGWFRIDTALGRVHMKTSFTASGGTTSAFGRDTLGGGTSKQDLTLTHLCVLPGDASYAAEGRARRLPPAKSPVAKPSLCDIQLV
ncbi:hypothetical protein Bbelb_302000 [Branchiostoma belcheri]|nr:hypothetical protein Bbelb_302000 [Branchiostoma belcheri]